MKITKARLKKAIKEAMEGATPDAQLAELFGFGKKAKAKKAAAKADAKARADASEAEYQAFLKKFDADEKEREAHYASSFDRHRQAKREKAKAAESSARIGGRAAAEADYEACKRSVQAAIRANRYGTHGNPSEADEARNRCSEQYRMAMKNVRENQSKEGKAKITKSQLKKVIQEEVEKILAEA